MPRAFQLPDLGEGIHESEVVAIHVAEGETVAEGDVILEVETDKATVEIPSPYSGKVIEVLVQIGDIIHVGTEMLRFEDDLAPKVSSDQVLKPKTVATAADQSIATSPRQTGGSEGEPIPASPATRRLARELNVELAQVSPTGPSGLVTAEDVRAFAEKKRLVAPGAEQPTPVTRPFQPHQDGRSSNDPLPVLPDVETYGPIKRIPLRSIRRSTARQMSLAWSQIPHVTSQDTIDITELEMFRKRHKNEIARQGGRLTFTVLALKAAVVALKAHPRANASLDTKTGEILLKQYYHLGVAVSTDDGLVVPVIRDVDQKSILALSVELDRLVERTRDRKVGVEELRGGTFTITNMGAIGGGAFTPIINYPEAAILGFGQARWQPVVCDKGHGTREIIPRYMVPVVLAVDHRIMDGVDAVKFIEAIKRCLQDPEWFFIHMS